MATASVVVTVEDSRGLRIDYDPPRMMKVAGEMHAIGSERRVTNVGTLFEAAGVTWKAGELYRITFEKVGG